jgi:hypothetical protein
MGFKAVLCTGEVQKGICMMTGIKMHHTWIGDEPATATERSVLNNFI